MRIPEFTSNAEVQRRHRNAVTWRIVAPVVVAALAIIVVAVALVIAFTSRQVDIVASFMSLLILLPAVLFCLVPYILLVVLFAVTRKAYFWLPSRLRTARTAAHQVNVVAHRLSMGVARPIISVNQRVAWIEQVTGRKPRRSVPMLPMERR